MNTIKRLCMYLVTAAFLTAACSDSETDKTVSVTGVKLNETTLELVEGGTETLTATVEPEDASNKEVTWTSSNPEVATVNNGVVTAVKPGTASITVATVDGNRRAACAVTVIARVYPVTGITLNETELELILGATFQLQAAVEPENATAKGVNWASSDTELAIVNSNGTVTALAVGTVTITAAARDGSGVAATCEVRVVTIPVTEIVLDLTEETINIGETLTLSATVSPENASDKRVEWSSDNTGVAEVTQDGVVAGKSAGTAIITATAKDGSGVSASFTITVNADPVLVTGIELNQTSATIKKGATITLTATVTPEFATSQALQWTSTNPGVAEVDQEGTVTGKGEGTATITVAATDGSNVSVTCEITVELTLMTQDLNRTEWTITSDQGNGYTYLPDGTTGMPEHVLTEGGSTFLALLKPGRSAGTPAQPAPPVDFRPYFIIDMKETQTFNYFRWRHRSTNNYNRLKTFAVNVYVSNDGEVFTQVTPNNPEAPDYPTWYWIPVAGGYVGDMMVADGYFSIDLQETLSTRYVKIEITMWAQAYDSHHPDWPGQGAPTYGNGVQIGEFGLGVSWWE